MKIRVIKKMMAYLLVGAMVLSTPMTASATEPSIADVYTDTDDGGAVGGQLVLELRDGVGKIVYLVVILARIPLVLAIGCVLKVASKRVVGNGVEEILKVVERNTGNLYALGTGG